MTMKETPADREVRDRVKEGADAMILSVVQRVEAAEAEMRDKASDRKEIYAEAKANGLSVKALKKIVAARKLDPDTRAEEDSLFDLYSAAVGLT